MTARGRTVARLLSGSWRQASTSALPSANELEACLSLLVDGGAAALAWMRVRGTALASTPAAARLRDDYRAQALSSAAQRRELANALAALSAVRVTALCAKGWAVARHYYDARTRAVGDVDLYVARNDCARAVEALAALDGDFDVHRGLGQLADRDFAAVVDRAERVDVEGQAASVLAPGDHLRLVCLHMLGHGAWRPLWLCDVAALVETGAVDWDACLDGDPRRARWIACAVVAARDLLDGDISSAPRFVRETVPPSWLPRTMLDAWSIQHPRREPIATYQHRLAALPAALWRRWPNAIEATVDVGGEFDDTPRLPLQLSECAKRIGRFARTLAR